MQKALNVILQPDCPADALPSAAVMSELQGCFQLENVSEVFNLCILIATRSYVLPAPG